MTKASELERGTTLNRRFVVQRRLGAGNFGVVYEVHDQQRDLRVALKRLRRLDASTIYHFKQEFRSLADVTHPNLLGLHELFSIDDQWYFTMDLVEGVDFLEYVRGPALAPSPTQPSTGGSIGSGHRSPRPSDRLPTPARAPSQAGSGTQVYGVLHQGADSQKVVPGTQIFGMPQVAAPGTASQDTASRGSGTQVFGSGPFAPQPAPDSSGGSWSGGQRVSLNEARLRQAMEQLVSGLGALHRAGKLHRDLKPSNVLVTAQGRVVVLDFGLVADISHESMLRGVEMLVAGTPAYMAPEQATRRELTPAADMYALGVMLYEALTGQTPFTGSTQEMLANKQTREPPDPRTLCPQLPVDLCEIAMRLLRRDPAQRMTAGELMSRLGGGDGSLSRAREPVRLHARDTSILGRERQLAIFAKGLTIARQGSTVVLFVHGTSGMGKSVLVRSFLDGLLRQGQVVVLEGRCYEREQVPYKALDSLIDSLTRHLMLQPRPEAEELIPRDTWALARLFPAVKRAAVVSSSSPEPSGAAGDPNELRRRGTVALRELLGRIALKRPLVLFIDDLQWSDSDSAALLVDLLRPPGPPLLLLASYRTEDAAHSEVVKALRPKRNQDPVPGHFGEVEVGPLSQEDARDLALALLGEDSAGAREDAQAISRESGGSPFFVAELSRYLRALRREGGGRPTRWLSLNQVISDRVGRLPENARQLLEVVSVAGRPLPFALARKVAALPSGSEQETLALLRGENLVRTKDPDLVESFHDRIREAVVAGLPSPALAQLHLRLAEALEGASAPAGVLAYHFLAGNDGARGLHFSLVAARAAQAQYANGDAAGHYREALEVLSSASFLDAAEVARQTRKVKEELARTLLQAGSYAEAASLFHECLAAEKEPRARVELHMGLGRVHQEKGETENAIQELERALKLLGLAAPRSLVGLGLKVLGAVVLRLLGALLPWLLRRPVSGDRRQDYLRRLGALISLIKIYYFVDIKKLTWATLVINNMAPRAGSDYGSSLARSYFGTLLFGAGLLKQSAGHCEAGLELARRAGDAAAEGIALSRLGTHATFSNKLARAMSLQTQAAGMFRQVGEMWELQTSLMMQATSRFLGSEFKAAEELYMEMGALGLKLNALMHQGWSHAWAPFCRYLLGTQDALSVRTELEEAYRISVQVDDLANQCAALNHLANVAVREQQPEEAAQLADRTFRSIWRYQVLVPFLQVGLVDAAEAALYALEEGATSVKRSRLLRIVRLSCLKAQLVASRYKYLAGPTLRVKARYARLKGRTGEAETLFMKAIELLADTPNRWEKGVACYDAAVALPHRREELAARAQTVFTAIGAEAELRRMQRPAAPGNPKVDCARSGTRP